VHRTQDKGHTCILSIFYTTFVLIQELEIFKFRTKLIRKNQTILIDIMAFVIKFDDLVELLNSKKWDVLRYIKKNYRENYHYIKDINFKKEIKQGGGKSWR
jgi:hypothetical protein